MSIKLFFRSTCCQFIFVLCPISTDNMYRKVEAFAELPEPRILGVRVTPLCYLIAVLLACDGGFQLYAVEKFWHYKSTPHLLIAMCIWLPALFTCFLLVLGLAKEHTTTIAFFLWGYIEVEMANMVYFRFVKFEFYEKLI